MCDCLYNWHLRNINRDRTRLQSFPVYQIVQASGLTYCGCISCRLFVQRFLVNKPAGV